MYGLTRSIPLYWDKKKEYTYTGTHVTIARQMPFMEKLTDSGCMILASPAFWPIYAYKDASRLEFYARGIDPRAYGVDLNDDYF